MSATSTDQTYLVNVRVTGRGFKVYEVEAPAASIAAVFAESMAAQDTGTNSGLANAVSVERKPMPVSVCATCNEPEFSEYAANCHAHTPDNMIEA